MAKLISDKHNKKDMETLVSLMIKSRTALVEEENPKALAKLSRDLMKYYFLAKRFPIISQNLKPLKQKIDRKERDIKNKIKVEYNLNAS